MPRWEICEVVSGSTVPTPLMAAEEAEKQNQKGENKCVWTHLFDITNNIIVFLFYVLLEISL